MSKMLLPSWRPGPTRDALVAFLDAALDAPVEARVACFDNDGTLWCERPTYPQYDFFADALARAAAVDPSLAERPEYAAVLGGDARAIGALGIERVAMALVGLFDGQPPEAYTAAVREFFGRTTHPVLGTPIYLCVYQPMLELIEAMRARRFTVSIVTGGGTEFVRAIGRALYGVPPELVVGTLLDHDVGRNAAGRIEVRRSTRLLGEANEGMAKIAAIQTQLGQRPMFAAGNSAGDREMMEWTLGGSGPSMALLIDHDDAEREFAYASESATLADSEPIVDVGRRLGFTVVSMAADWAQVFPD